MTMEEILNLLRDCGAARAAAIRQSDVVYNAAFRDICAQNACGLYGTCYMCPPDIGPIEALMAKAQQYPVCFMYQTVSVLEDSFDYEGMIEAKKVHHRCAQRIDKQARALLKEGFLHLEAGGCGMCARCAKLDGIPCRFPDKALSSLEGYGIDVYQTALHAGLPYVNGQNTVTYFGMIFLPEDLSE